MVNGTDVQEHMNGGTSVIPNLDSIQEFRVLTNNFDPEYGNYNGGMINVITKSGNDAFHGTAFEFLRNTDLDAKNYFDATRGLFRQNQFGGTVGGPIKKQKFFFFTDYQGTRTVEGITSPASQVLSGQERSGNFSDAESTLTGNRQRTERGQNPDAGAWLWRHPRRALLCARVFFSRPMRPPQWDHSHARVVGARPKSVAVHSHAQHRLESVCHFGISRNRAGRQGSRPDRREYTRRADFRLLLH